jgi:ribosomal-protein-alanine N-acetyltransferase
MMHLAAASATAAQWRREDYERVFEDMDVHRWALVIEAENKIVGFLVGLGATTEWEIENVAVAPDARRRGLGTRLVGEFLDFAKDEGAESVFLEVRESNHAARALYEKWAFVESGRRRGYYADPAEDAMVYRFVFPREETR